ncbi:hypothetical protein GCM10010329_58580 [Streptomyces spiroverticillatus]|uniref:Uncharacterized protein n=1 Tax=Streptomyces finlayi TaxID=67296 RepID=A0A918X3K6_9ACTN|nr:hypothetical protein [Streptomyces finlayi]GHA27595.1 hypothetical protein GCM10010329_58580 [Streptomyces spiroverticillatus]GHD08688.1 hypothetical protein GCM10010334_62240 [Streptomyces finlayi]
MDTEKSLAALELAVQRLREAEVALNAARADVETEAVAAAQAGQDLDEVTALSGIPTGDLRTLSAQLGEIPPR